MRHIRGRAIRFRSAMTLVNLRPLMPRFMLWVAADTAVALGSVIAISSHVLSSPQLLPLWLGMGTFTCSVLTAPWRAAELRLRQETGKDYWRPDGTR